MRTFADRGIVAAASSDAPVVPVNPLLGIQTMVTRRDRLGVSVFPEESIPIEDALRAYTWAGAYAAHQEHRKGSLEPGKLADVTVFEHDLREVDPLSLEHERVDMTVAGGEVVYVRST
jgi:predicted amidohydrolase YtcJ